MAERPIYIPSNDPNQLVRTKYVQFEWVKGMAFSQKQKCVDALHHATVEALGFTRILEVSSKSREELGVKLSAFNLMIDNPQKNLTFSVECAFQSGKIFENGGPFPEILKLSSREAKKFFYDKEYLGGIIGFQSNGYRWPNYPTTLFYDWLYVNALSRKSELIEELIGYDAFSDIEFNPQKSKNCQAYSVALFCSLKKQGLLDKAISSKESFKMLISSKDINNAHEDQSRQPSFL